ncbi:hypothetical protein RI129_006286 [Pyrocoelia pectoralis]|uniref:Alanine--glyoxylate aminotransferase n=1 Tax=Pyrocoelia pectoralis TaxID=417401 RepID=A0AAN7VGY9_9COLE
MNPNITSISTLLGDMAAAAPVHKLPPTEDALRHKLLLKKRPYHPGSELVVGGGPCNCSPRVLQTFANAPILLPGVEVYEIMAELKEMLKYVFQTKNEATLALQTSGTGGIDASLTNILEPGEKVIVGVMGEWGERIADVARTRQLEIIELIPQYSLVFTIDELAEAIIKHRPALLYITHGETSTGVFQNLEGLGDICHKYNCLFAVDTVVTLGTIPLHVDRWNIDIAVSASQKGARSLPGLAYLTFSPRAVKRIQSLKTPSPFYYNMLELFKIWNCLNERSEYYYTYNSNLLSAAKEGLAEIIEDGLLETWNRHKILSKKLWKGLEKLELKLFVKDPKIRLFPVTSIHLPPGVAFRPFKKYLVDQHHMHVGRGLGLTSNSCFRIGIMGYNARSSVVDFVLEKISEAIEYFEEESRNTFILK